MQIYKNSTRRGVSILIIVLLFITCTSLMPGKKKTQKPNILIFMVDDIGQGDIGAYNAANKTLTPNIDQLVKGGVSFHHAHSSASVCAPTRYSLLSGNHVYRGKRPKGTWGHMEASQILPGQETLADQLRKNNYHTAFYGKVHLGGFADIETGTYKDGPFDHGFDYSLALPNGIQGPPYVFFKNGRMVRYTDGEFEALSQKEINKHLIEWPKKRKGKKMDNYTHESVGPLLMHDALQFLNNHFDNQPDRPFYIHYMSQAGHTPHTPPVAFNVDKPLETNNLSIKGAIPIAGSTINRRTDMVYESDVSMGLFVAKLKELGQLENTIIVYTSDNGVGLSKNYTWTNPVYEDYRDGAYGGDRMEFADPGSDSTGVHMNGQGLGLDGIALRGKKGYVYEGGHRIPLIWHWGGENGVESRFPAGKRINDQIINLTDVYRTICTLAGIKVPDDQALDSFDFSHVLVNPTPVSSANQPVREYMAIQANRHAESAEPNNKRYAWSFYYYDDDFKIWDAIISKRLNNKVTDVEGEELYNLTIDEDQSEEIERKHAALMASLVEAYSTFLNQSATHQGQLRPPISFD